MGDLSRVSQHQLAEMTQERDRLLQQLAECTRDRQDVANETLNIIQQVRREKYAAIRSLNPYP